MNKQELLDALSAKFYRLGVVAAVVLSDEDNSIREIEGVKWYIAGVYEEKDDMLIRRNIPFYVINEGEPTEIAKYKDTIPINNLPNISITTFRDIVTEAVNTRIASGNIEKANIDMVNEDKEFATLTVYLLDTNEIVIKQYFVYSDKDSVLQFKVIRS